MKIFKDAKIEKKSRLFGYNYVTVRTTSGEVYTMLKSRFDIIQKLLVLTEHGAMSEHGAEDFLDLIEQFGTENSYNPED